MMSITENRTQKIAYLTTFFSLYIAQAVPMSFFTTALQVVMREQAIPLSIIGLLQLLKLPWIFKAFWACHRSVLPNHSSLQTHDHRGGIGVCAAHFHGKSI